MFFHIFGWVHPGLSILMSRKKMKRRRNMIKSLNIQKRKQNQHHSTSEVALSGAAICTLVILFPKLSQKASYTLLLDIFSTLTDYSRPVLTTTKLHKSLLSAKLKKCDFTTQTKHKRILPFYLNSSKTKLLLHYLTNMHYHF